MDDTRHPHGAPDTTSTVAEFAQTWLEARVDLADRTVELYGWLLRRHIEPGLGSIEISALTPVSVRSWYGNQAKQHPTTAAKAYRLLSAVMRTAVDDELIARNPCQVRGAATERAPERPIAAMQEVDEMAGAMPERLRIAVYLAAWCQLRRAEVRGLRRQDVDLASGTLSVSETRTTAMSGRTVVKPPKTRAGRRVVAIPPNVTDLLAWHLEHFVEQAPDSLVVCATDRSLGTAWRKARIAAGRPDLRFHDLRHSGLTWAAESGASLAELMRRAGHSSQAAAVRYQHATDRRDRALADAMAGLAERDSRARTDLLSAHRAETQS